MLPRRTSGFRHDYSHYRHPWREFQMPDWQRWLVKHSDLYASLEARESDRITLNAFVAVEGIECVSADAPAAKMPPSSVISI